MSKPYTVFEPIGFTEPIPGLRRTTAQPKVELRHAAWPATELLTEEPSANSAKRKSSGRRAPLLAGITLLAMAGAGWAMLQARSEPPLPIPALAELAPALTQAPQIPPVAPAEQAADPAAEAPRAQTSEPLPVAPQPEASAPAKAVPISQPKTPPTSAQTPGATLVAKRSGGDLLKELPAPAAGTPPKPVATPIATPIATPFAPPLPASAPAPADIKPEPALVSPPPPPASAASS